MYTRSVIHRSFPWAQHERVTYGPAMPKWQDSRYEQGNKAASPTMEGRVLGYERRGLASTKATRLHLSGCDSATVAANQRNQAGDDFRGPKICLFSIGQCTLGTQ